MTSATTNMTTTTLDQCAVATRSTVIGRRMWTPIFLLALLLIAATYLRFSGLDRESRWCDEYQQTGSYAKSPWYVILAARDAAQPPLDYLVGWAIHKIDPSLWAMRAPAAAFGMMSIALTFMLVRRFTDWTTGLIAAGLIAFSPFHFQMSQTARPYTIFLTTLLLMLWALIASLERPNWRRMITYGATATLMILTRGMAPPVILLATAITLGAFAIVDREPQARNGLLFACMITVIVGMLSAGVTAFLVAADQSWSVFSAAGAMELNDQNEARFSRLLANLYRWTDAPRVYFEGAGICVMAFAGLGAAVTLVNWRRISMHSRVMVSVFAASGPMFVVIYTLAVRQWPLASRYAFFLLPFVAALAGIGIVSLTSALARRLGAGGSTTRWTSIVAGLALIAIPARATIKQSRSYSNPDWRGCAAYLQNRVTGDDVIMVIQDRPVGEYQSTFWGKYEWPRGFNAPLAEAADTFVTSPSHWNRLLHQTGRCYLVIYHQIAGQTADAYRNTGLQTAPEGTTLTKFRGLDLLELQSSKRGLAAVSEACRVSLAFPLMNSEVRTIPAALMKKIEQVSKTP